MKLDRSVLEKHEALRAQLAARIRGKAKPVGSLGQLEDLAIRIGMATNSLAPTLGPAKIVVFAADHGITAEGVTAYPSVVTREIAKLIAAGGAGINVVALAVGVDVLLVDAGLLEPLPPECQALSHRIESGTRNWRIEPAMDDAACHKAIAAGRKVDETLSEQKIGIVAFGEVGIGNTSAAAAISHVLTGIDLAQLVGLGAGTPPQGLSHKLQVITDGVRRARIETEDTAARAFEALRQFGGFEIAMMAGAMMAAADAGRIVVVDGFISTAAALAAIAMSPAVLVNCVFAHCSAEAGHKAVLDFLDAKPLLNLDLRLGEGTGAALAIPIIRAAEIMLREMADLPGGEHPS